METNELLTSLARLENTLQEVESAKNQVKQTVDAYEVLQNKFSEYTKSLDSIKTSIHGIVSDLRFQRASLEEEATSIASSLHAEAERLFNKLSEETTSVLNTLKTELTAINVQYARDSKAVADGFKNSTDEQLTKLQQSVLALKECTTALEGLQTSVKDTLAEITQMKQGIAELKQALMDSQGSQDTVLNSIKEGVKSLSEHQEQAASELSKKCDSIKDSQASSFASMENLIKSNAERLDLLGNNSSRESRLVKILLLSNIALVVIIGFLLFFLK